MEQCSNCRQELQPGFDFCHHCGAAASQHAAAKPAQSNLVELVGDLEQIATRSMAAGSTANQTISDWLGSPVSVQRRIIYALLTGLAVILAAGWTPSPRPFQWLEGWLLFSLLTLPMISYWITGFIPLSNIFNAVVGDALSLRRRLLVTFLWATPPTLLSLRSRFALIEVGASNEGVLRALSESFAVYIGHLLITYYFMGQATVWRPVLNLERSLFLNRMAGSTAEVGALIRDQIQGRNVQRLQTTEIGMAKIRRYTAGESSGRLGSQLCFTKDRARVVLFVQDFGHSLFIRWAGYFDTSERRIWIFFGLMLSSVNNLVWRWTGTNPFEFWRDYMNIVKPTSRSNVNFLAMARGGLLSRMFGMAEGVSEYGWNELYALEASIRETVANVAFDAQEAHEEADVIQTQIERHSRLEIMNTPQNLGQTGPR